MQIETIIRYLARTSHWQNLYKASKDTGIHLFLNITNFSAIQVNFLYWLRVYSVLYAELSAQENRYLTQNVINDDVRTDAYLYYRNKKVELENKKAQIETQTTKLRGKKKHSGKGVTPFSVDMIRG